MPVIPATWEVESGGSRVHGQPRQRQQDSIFKTNYNQKGWGVALLTESNTHIHTHTHTHTHTQNHKYENMMGKERESYPYPPILL
jgi:hypothetical protein